MADLPKTQHAVQLVGPDRLVFNKSKELLRPGRHQLLCRVEAVGLCFSDLKLLKQFSSHTRKGRILSGIDLQILKQIPGYVPDDATTVPGHEATVTIETVGPGVENFKPGHRYIIQADYRWLQTAASNAAFGYNFEGALQEYVLFDERVITSPQGRSTLIPISKQLSASAAALIEPWACVEHAYTAKERRTLKTNGQMLIVADIEPPEDTFRNLFNRYGRPAQITWISQSVASDDLNVPIETAAHISQLTDTAYDDVVYFGSRPDTIEALFPKLAVQGLLNIVLCSGKLSRAVLIPVGRIHYNAIRIIGTVTSDPAESMEHIPQTGEIRPRDKINIIGAAGPMGMMHVIRNICNAAEGISIFAADIAPARLTALTKIAAPLAAKNNVTFKAYNPSADKIEGTFNYIVLMAPAPDLLTASVKYATGGAVINIFAGIPADVTTELDLNAYLEKKLYFIATSGSTLDDMKKVLAEVESGRLDTNICVAAICGLDGAVEGIRAIENRTIPGKIIVYPACKNLPLTPLKQLNEKMPKVAACLNNGLWTNQAEQMLLQNYQ